MPELKEPKQRVRDTIAPGRSARALGHVRSRRGRHARFAEDRGEGLRIGTVRRPPRGVKKSSTLRDYYDVWLPELRRANFQGLGVVETLDDRTLEDFRTALPSRDGAALPGRWRCSGQPPKTADFSVGCYCEDAS